MALLGDHLTDRDKVEYFMASLVNRSYPVKKINLSCSFDQAFRDVIGFVSKEKIATTIMNQYKHRLPLGTKLNNIKPFEDEYDFEAINQGQHQGRSSGSQNSIKDRNLNAMELYALQMDWVNKLTPEEKRRFENQLCQWHRLWIDWTHPEELPNQEPRLQTSRSTLRSSTEQELPS
jgi:hypothetical protein